MVRSGRWFALSLLHPMNTNTDQSPAIDPVLTPAAKYRAAHRNRLMLLTQLKNELPTRSEFCRILSVETAAPSLWITVGFLDGSRGGFRPEKLRLVTADEERFSNELLAGQPAV